MTALALTLIIFVFSVNVVTGCRNRGLSNMGDRESCVSKNGTCLAWMGSKVRCKRNACGDVDRDLSCPRFKRCCIPIEAENEDPCTSKGGTCQSKLTKCDGRFTSDDDNDCPTQENCVQCCLPNIAENSNQGTEDNVIEDTMDMVDNSNQEITEDNAIEDTMDIVENSNQENTENNGIKDTMDMVKNSNNQENTEDNGIEDTDI